VGWIFPKVNNPYAILLLWLLFLAFFSLCFYGFEAYNLLFEENVAHRKKKFGSKSRLIEKAMKRQPF